MERPLLNNRVGSLINLKVEALKIMDEKISKCCKGDLGGKKYVWGRGRFKV